MTTCYSPELVNILSHMVKGSYLELSGIPNINAWSLYKREAGGSKEMGPKKQRRWGKERVHTSVSEY